MKYAGGQEVTGSIQGLLHYKDQRILAIGLPARAAATPSGVAPTLSVMSQVSLSVLVMRTLSESR
jgi:hypothetical protein